MAGPQWLPSAWPVGWLWKLARPAKLPAETRALRAMIFEIARELRPEGRLQVGVLAHRDGAGLGQRRLHVGDGGVEVGEAVGLGQDGQVVLAVGGAAGAHVVARLGQFGAQAVGVVVGRAQPAQRQAHAVQRRLALDEGEALGQHQLHRQPQHPVEAWTKGSPTCRRALAEAGAIAVREDIELEPAFWAQFPGNFKYIARKAWSRPAISPGLASFHNFPIGQAEGNHWGPAVAVLETTSAGPYYFNFHNGDLGNFTVIGPSGSGKTVVLNFLLAQAERLSRGSSSSTRTAGPNSSSARSAAATT